MKKWIGLLLLCGLVGLGWWSARTFWRVTPAWAQPKFGKVTVGDIRVPITAAGLIQAQQVIDVKCKASGEIIELPVVEGDFVRKGDVLVLLKRDDEQRRLDSTKAELDQRSALLAQAEIEIERSRANILTSEARLEELRAQARIAEFDWQKVQMLKELGNASEQEQNDVQARLDVVRAQIRAAEAAVQIARLAVRTAEAEVEARRAGLFAARKNLEDADERLRETTVVASLDAIVTEVIVKRGMLVQSGTQSLTGGTILMKLADVSSLKVLARLDEADYGRVQAISPIEALPNMPGLRESAAAQQAGADASSRAAATDRTEAGTNGTAATAPRTGLVTVTVDAFPEDEFTGRIERMEPQGKLNPGSSIIQFDVHVEVTDERRYRLPLGAQAQVEFTVEQVEGVLRVPSEGVKSFEGERGVWVRIPPEPGSGEQWGRKFVRCRFGITDGEYTEVVAVADGQKLEAGMEIFTRMPQTSGD